MSKEIDAGLTLMHLAIYGHIAKQIQDAGGKVPFGEFSKVTTNATNEVAELLKILGILE